MKNVVAYSLWGNHPMYWAGALRNIELVNKFYPGFIARFYIDSSCSPALITTIKGRNTEVVRVNSRGAFHGMFWRFWAAADSDVGIFLSRDCDSRISEREVAAVNEWLFSRKDFHIMRDHPQHRFPILGGMWGCRKGILRDMNIIKRIEDWKRYANKGCDQDFLGQVIYPNVKTRAMEHSEFNINYGSRIRPFPCKRDNYEYVGEVFDENNCRHAGYLESIKKHLRREVF